MSELIELEPAASPPTPEQGGPLLEIEDLRVTFPTEEGDVHAVRGVDLVVYPGETLGVVGESGSGKSVTMLAMMGLLPKTARIEGSARYRGEELLTKRQAHPPLPRRPDRHDLPGPAHGPEPCAARGRPDQRGGAGPQAVARARRRQGAGDRDARPGRASRSRRPGRGSTRTSSPAACASGR